MKQVTSLKSHVCLNYWNFHSCFPKDTARASVNAVCWATWGINLQACTLWQLYATRECTVWQNDQLQLITTIIRPVLYEQLKAARRSFISNACTMFWNSLQVMHLIMSCTESCWQVLQSQDTSVCLAFRFIPLILPDLREKLVLLFSSFLLLAG